MSRKQDENVFAARRHAAAVKAKDNTVQDKRIRLRYTEQGVKIKDEGKDMVALRSILADASPYRQDTSRGRRSILRAQKTEEIVRKLFPNQDAIRDEIKRLEKVGTSFEE